MIQTRHAALLAGLATGLLASSASAWQLSRSSAEGVHRLFDGDGTLLRESQRPIEDAALRTFPGSPVRVLTWNERVGEDSTQALYRISLDGRQYARVRETSFTLELNRGSFDPLVDAPSYSIESVFDESAVEAGRIYIVQYVTQPLELFRAGLRDAGAEILRYLPRHAQIVRMSAETATEVAELPFVRWVGRYHPEYRLGPALLAGLETESLPSSGHYHLQVWHAGSTEKARVAERIEALGGEVTNLYPEGLFLEARLSPQALLGVTAMDEIVWIDERGEPQTYMDKVRQDGGANFLENQTGYTGQGVRGEVLDSGLLVGHQAFQSNPPVLHGGNSTDTSHGTSCSGCIFGDGTGNALGRATLPDGQLVFASFYNLGNRYTHTSQLLSNNNYKCVFQSNSWGYGTGLTYNNWSTQIDDILFQYDITILHAQANTGGNSSDYFAWGKNVVSVGGIRHFNTQTVNDDAWQNAGSRGPAADGRIKPDLSYWYDSILTTSNSGGYTSSFGGTSAATPETAGFFGLFYQMWHEGLFGNTPTGATVFESRPKATTAKAMMINTADQYAFSGAGADLRRVTQGWGRADVQRIYQKRDNFFIVNEDDVLTNLQTASYQLTVPAGQDQFRATLVYLDPSGTTSSSQHRINDLSLRVTDPSGGVWWGNNQMKGNMFTQPGTSSNTVDTVENVWLEAPQPGTWTVEVLADEVNQDAHVETGAVDVDFALVVSGVENTTCPATTSYCTAAANSFSPGGAQIDMSGSQIVADNDVQLLAWDVPPGQNGIFFYGSGQQSTPFGQGFLCVSGQLFRLGIVQADLFGTAQTTVDLTNPPSAAGQITGGSTWNFQFWYRDPAGGGAAFNLSNGLSVPFCD